MSSSISRWWLRALCALAVAAGAGPVAAQDLVFADSFEDPFGFPADDAEAARFLTQATFGPTTQDIATLRAQGYSAWLDQQIALPGTMARPALEQIADTLPSGQALTQADRVDRWFDQAVTANDQLRQRMSFALSQIFVVSDRGDILSGDVAMVAEYQDILARHAFGNYRDLLRDVSYSPMMGRYLSHYRNRKKESTYEPDENYAREIMQLFSIGLIERNRDFSPILVGGLPVPTYDQYTITNTARVFTGLAFQCRNEVTLLGRTYTRDCGDSGTTCSGVDCNFQLTNWSAQPGGVANALGNTNSGLVHPDRYSPMLCYPRYHDTGLVPNSTTPYPPRPGTPVEADEPYDTKRIIADILLPAFDMANAGQQTCHGAGSPPTTDQTVRQACVTYCGGELDAELDALFLHDNTPPFIVRQLIQRFVTSSPSPAYIDRVAAVFEDDNGAGAGGVRGNLAAVVRAILLDVEARQPPTGAFGKVREPLLRITNVWRSFGAVSVSSRRWGLSNPENSYQQRPLGAPTVFNFYEPDYQQPGAIADAGLYSPELAITNETTTISVANDLWTRIWVGYSATNGTFTTPVDGAYLPPAVIDALPADDDALLEALNLRLMYGSMSGTFTAGTCNGTGMKQIVIDMLRCQLAGVDRRRRILSAIHLIATSPEYLVQR